MSEIVTATVHARGIVEAHAAASPVPWWSFSKFLLAAACLRLAEQGRLSLDEPLPDLPYTPRQLLQHRAGVGDYGRLPEYQAAVARGDEPWTEQELHARVNPAQLLFAPGTGWSYSNVGYLRVRRIIEHAHGADLKDALRDLILAPLGLRASRVAVAPADMRDTRFPGGRRYHPGWAFHGFVVGPAVEAALALHELLTGDLLSPDSRAALLVRHPIGGEIPGRPWHATGYGLGLAIGTMQRPGMPRPMPVIGHSAAGPGSVGAVYHDPEGGRTVAAFAAGADEGVPEHEVLRRLVAD